MTNQGVCQDITGGGGWRPVLLLLQSSERAGHAITMTSEEGKYMCGRPAGYLGLMGGGNQGTVFLLTQRKTHNHIISHTT